MNLQRIDLFCFPKGQQFGVQHAFTEGLQKAFVRLGLSSTIYPYQELGDGKIISELVKTRPDITAGFNVCVAKHSPLEPLAIAHLSMIVDSACYFPELLQNPNAIVSFVDEDSVGFFKMLGCRHAFYLPHAIDVDVLDKDLEQERDLDVVMLGSYIDADEIVSTWNTLLTKENANRLLDLSKRVLHSDTLSYLQAFVELVEEKGAFEQELMQKQIPFFDLLNSIDVYIRGVDRVRILDAIDQPVHIFGRKAHEERWAKAIKDPKKCIFHPEVPYTEVDSILMRSRVCVHSFPMFKRGLHERILMAFACGASVLGNDTHAVKGFKDAYLPYLGYDKVNDLLDKALNDEEKRLKNVQKTHGILRDEHTWDVRAKMLQDVLPPILEEVAKDSKEGVSHFFT